MSLCLDGVTKHFAGITAVDGASFTVPTGSVFGFLGTNGAGKTTTVRMILRILLPDAGHITWRGQPLTEAGCRTFGYLPEERGLYPKMKVLDQLVYLAHLHGMSLSAARASVSEWLERMELGEHAHKRVEQLSKGNQQKVQFVAAVAHRPDLVMLDEPFSGLDPLNVRVLHASLLHLKALGTTVVFSSHRLDQVEELCTEVALIHRARILLAGAVRDIKRQTGRHVVRLDMAEPDKARDLVPGVTVSRASEYGLELQVPEHIDPQAVLRAAVAVGAVRRFELGEPSLEEIYLEKVRGA